MFVSTRSRRFYLSIQFESFSSSLSRWLNSWTLDAMVRTKKNDAREIRTPHDVFCIRFCPELEKWLEGRDGKSGSSCEMLTLFGRTKDFCKQIRSSKNYLLKRMHNDQWLHSKITLKNHQPIHVAVAQKPQGEVLQQLPADGDSKGVMGSPNCPSTVNNDITFQSNILPRQASLEKLRSVATSQFSKYLSLSWLLADAGVAGTSGLERLVSKALTEWKKGGTCELREQLSRALLQDINHVKLPNIPSLNLLDETLIETINKGKTSVVSKVTISQGLFAKKTFNSLAEYRSTIQIVQKLSHPHIVHSFGCISSSNSTESSLLMECMESDLCSWIFIKKPQLEPLEALNILLQVAQAMEYLHGVNVVHGDLKSSNILISEFNISEDVGPFIVVKLSDFGSAQALPKSNREPFRPSEGTTRWAAPEVLRSRGTANLPKDTYLKNPLKIDVFSFGITAFELLTSCEPFEGERLCILAKKRKDHDKRLAEDFSKKFTAETQKYPESFISFMQRCWAYKPNKRPSFHEIIEKIEKAKNRILKTSTSKPGLWTRKWNAAYQEVSNLKNLVVPKRAANQVSPHLTESNSSMGTLVESSSLEAGTTKRKHGNVTLPSNKRSKS